MANGALVVELQSEILRLKRVVEELRDELSFSSSELIRRQKALKVRLAAAQASGLNSSWKAEDEERMFGAVEELEDMLVGFEEHEETLTSRLHEVNIIMSNAHKVANLEKKKSATVGTQTDIRGGDVPGSSGFGHAGVKRMAKAAKRVRTIVKLMPKVR